MDYDNSNADSKKNPKADAPMSKVVHVRNLPPDCTEQDLIAVACPFGRVVNVLMLKGKNQAFIQMQDHVVSTSLVQYYNSVQANIRGKPVYFQFSTRDEIQAPQNSPSTPAVQQQNSILLVTIQNVLYPITIDILHQIFSKYGAILKIAIFSKTGLQALIQYTDVSSAVNARVALDGQNIYSGCCTLRIGFSNLTNLNVKFNNEKSRDFTNPSLPSSPSPMGLGGLGVGASLFPEASGWPQGGYGQPNSFMKSPPSAGGPGVGGTSVVIVNNLDPEKPDIEGLFNLFGVYGDVIRIKILYNKKDTALVQYANPQQADTALLYLNGCPLNGRHIQVNASKHTSVAMPPPGADEVHSNLTRDYTNSPNHRYKVAGSKNFQNICPPSQVLHISNIPMNATDDMMRELFAQYGNVVGFKFFSKDKKMGLVQMGSVPEAVESLLRLHNFKLSDGETESTIKVSFSGKSL